MPKTFGICQNHIILPGLLKGYLTKNYLRITRLTGTNFWGWVGNATSSGA